MSIRYTMTCVCDGCGVEMAKSEPRASGIDSARWAINRRLKEIGAMTRELYRRPTRHYCKICADGNGSSSPNDSANVSGAPEQRGAGGEREEKP